MNGFTGADIPWNGTGRQERATAAAKPLADTLHDLQVFIQTYVVLTDPQATLLALWAATTHAIDAFDFAAYLHITSPLPECGKSRLLEVLEALVANPWMTGRVTAAVLMRKLERDHPVLLLDESDAAFAGDEQYSESLRGMLNAGFHREGKASCCVGQGSTLTFKDFSVFGPKAIAGIGRLPSTVESRSIPIVMKRRTKGEVIQKWRRRDAWTQATVLRDELAAVLAGRLERLRSARPSMPLGLSDRVEDVVEPLLAVAELAGGDWPQAARAAAVGLMGQVARAAREADQSLALELLSDIRHIFGMYFATYPEKDAIATKVLIERLVALEDRPWGTFGKSEKPITGHRLARLLKGFEIEPAGTMREGDVTFKGYRRVVFTDAFTRYLGSEASQRDEPNKTGPESPKAEASHPEDVTLSQTAEHPNKQAGCDTVTLPTLNQGGANCCEGGPVQPRCKLCRQSPSYWQGRPN